MKISRIFRKYSRVLLLVFMSLLLVVFLLGDVIGRGAQSQADRDIEIGTAFGKTVTLNQTLLSENEFQLARQLGMQTPPVSSEDPQEFNIALHLLMEEARRAGVVIGRERVIDMFRGANPEVVNMLLDRIRKQTGRSLDSIYDAAGRVLATVEYAGYQASALAGASLPEVEHLYRDQNQEARIQVSVIDAKAFLDSVPAPTEEELLAHFEQCKDRDSAHTDDERLDGYRIGDRVQIEYMTVDPTAIELSVRVSSREAQRYYEENQQKYMREVAGPQVSLDDNPEPQKIQMSYDEVKDQVRDDCRKAKAIQEAQKLVNLIYQEARRPWDTAPMGENNRRQAPAAGSIVSFEELKAKHSAEYPVFTATTEWLTARELGRVRGLSRASAVISRQPTPMSKLAYHVDGLAEYDEKDELPLLRVNEPGPLAMETRTLAQGEDAIPYQAYVFRVVGVTPAGPPESMDEVRDRMISDLKQLKAFELAGDQAHLLAKSAEQIGLTEAVAGAEELRQLLKGAEVVSDESNEAEVKRAADAAERYVKLLDPVEPEQFRRQARFLKDIGYSPSMHEKVFASSSDGGPNLNEAHPVIAVPLGRSMKWAVIEVLEILPVYQGDFDQQREQVESQASIRRLQQFWGEWFDAKNILTRTGFERLTPATED